MFGWTAQVDVSTSGIWLQFVANLFLFFILPMLHFCVCQKMKDILLMKIRERLTNRQTADKRNIRKALSLTHRAGGLWEDGIWNTGVFRHPNLPLFFSPVIFSESSHSPSIVILPPIGGGLGECDTQTVIISPLEIGRRLHAFWCTLISVIAYIFWSISLPRADNEGRFT